MKKILDVIKEKYGGLSTPAKASIWFAICSFMQKGISMITVPIFTRILTTEQYGVFTVYQSWYNIIAIFATLNLSMGVFYNGMIKYENDRNRYTSAMQGLSTTVTAALFVVYILFWPFWNRLLQLDSVFIIAMFVELLFVPAYQLWCARQRFDYQYRRMIVATMIIAVFSPLVGVVAVLCTQYKAEARVLSYVGVQVVVGLVLYLTNFKKGKALFVKEYWKFALGFNIPLIPHYLSMMILGQSDRIMISRMVGTGEAAIYTVAYNIGLLMQLITNAISNSFNPYTYKAIQKKEYQKIGENANFLLLLVAVTACGIMLLGPEIIRIFAAPAYYEARWVIPPVAVSTYFIFCYPLFSNVEFYFEEKKYVACASLIGAVTNVMLNAIFIPIFGFVAAGYTTLFCYAIFVVCHYLFHKKVIAQNIPGAVIYNMKTISAISLGLVVIMVLITMTYTSNLLRYLLAGAMAAVLFIKRNSVISRLKVIRKK